MNQAQMKPLNLDDEFEPVVNTGTMKRRKATAKRVLKKLRIAVTLLVLILVSIVLWLFGVVPSIPAVIITEALSCTVCFIFGQLWEVINR